MKKYCADAQAAKQLSLRYLEDRFKMKWVLCVRRTSFRYRWEAKPKCQRVRVLCCVI